MKATFTALLSLCFTMISAQEMNPGFDLLEAGKYQDAEEFFFEVIREYPENKTARLCYGRAIGLNGKPELARDVFARLLELYPADLELKLNFAESLLWNKEFENAKKYYEVLIVQNENSFPILLGYANTLSNLKQYNMALEYIERALKIEPSNPNALISRKYIRLGLASKQVENNQSDKALALLKQNLEEFPNDQDTRLSMINLHLVNNNLDEAEAEYLTLKDSITALTGLSLISHKRRKEKLALQWASKANKLAKISHDSTKILMAHERYIQALIWNNKYSKAEESIEKLEVLYPGSNTVKSLKAMHGMYTGKISNSIQVYKDLLAKDSTSFDGNLGIANAYRAQGNFKTAQKYASKTLQFYPNQKDALSLLGILEKSMAPVSVNTVSYSKDNGNNEAVSIGSYLELPISANTKGSLGYTYRTTENLDNGAMAYNTNITFGVKQRIINNTWLEGSLGFLKANAETNSYSDVNGSLFVSSRPLPKQYLKIGYGRELQNFNATLIDEKIFMNNFMVNYNMGTNFGLGWYTGYTYTSQTDDNVRNLLFTSLYYQFTDRPLLKGGLNYQFLGFKEQVPELYFSPSKYQAVEIFFDLSGSSGKWNYSLNGAGGFQFVDEDKASSLFRFEGKAGYQISGRLLINAYSKYSNIASETATGFKFTEVGLSIRWQFLKAPVFRSN